EVHEVVPGRPNVVAWLGDKDGGPSLLLEGHTDVVTEGDPREWTHPPFGAELVDGRIYGRGAADMKGGLAAAMIAAAAVRKSGATLHGRLVIGALVDEEGDMLGVHHFCTTPLGRELSGAIICEPEQNEVCLEQRGVVWARVLIRGRMAHGAMARCPGATIEWAPINGVRLATRVERSEPLVQAVASAVRQVTGRPARFGGVPGSTDGTILRTSLGIPIVTLGPGKRLIPHQV